ncbi:NAD(P)H-hydrate dehydratase [Geotoga petraea]|jgi:NAD(P)H-hydrate epimerase|uniref:Bifunctional NAD(P)H-hydrate repair enzyme n=1 Tax=Geotoga petraea TaxID=28234 RepID=A0A1G6IAU8_9BACT|nr:NAD(P)H-hydrate dehydratase [Geotoga petraea]MDK2945596.1 ADP-dependent NAD(P)H-hydrate dehydratase / NAD(P)H-hydrate epimerase [Geotoga sp.]SDC03662.1 NAD(P)H-hydrate epimerase [Geotoga petraea]
MYIVNSKEMKNIDELTISKGLQESILMEQAAFSVKEIVEDLNPKKILVMAGTGNNGGDGLAVARLLKNDGYDVQVYIIGNEENASYGFVNQKDICKEYQVDFIDEIKDLNNFDVLVDGIIGVGLAGEIKGELLDIIDHVNSCNCKVVSIDIPTGISSDTGKIMKKAIKADITVTFGYLKIGHLLYPGRSYSGEIKLSQMSFYKGYEKNLKRFLLTEEKIRDILPKRPKDSHKYNFGSIAVIAGSKEYSGAPILSALGAQLSGAGMVYLITPSYTPILEHEPSVIYTDFNKNYFEKNDLIKIKGKIEKSDVILIGPGIGQNSNDFIKEILEKYSHKKIVIDADAIGVIKKVKTNKNMLITPHAGEFQKLLKKEIESIEDIENYSLEKNINVLYKSTTSLITDGDNSYFNVFGNDALSKGGTGDLVSGVIASYIAQGCTVIDSTLIATYLVYKTGYDLGIENTNFTVTPLQIAKNLNRELIKLRGD